ncbi:MAG: tetratricopeptide repeat protein, partial [Planctomycetota bacterium]
PVVNLTLMANAMLSGERVWSYHALNLVVHLLAALTLFGVVRRTILLGSAAREDRAAWFAFGVALLWLVHPLQTESVTYIIQRAEALMGLFYLLTLYAVVRGAGSARPLPWYLLALVACCLGMASKAVMVTVPVVVLLYDWIFLASGFRELLRRRWPLYLGLFAMYAVLFAVGVVQAVFAIGRELGFAHRGITPLEYLRSQPEVILHYLALCVWPRELVLDYSWPVAQDTARIAVTGALIVTLLALTAWALLRRPRLGFLGAWFFLILAPTSSVVPIRDLAVEHRMYLPLAAIIAATMLAGGVVLRGIGRRLNASDRLLFSISALTLLAITVALTIRTVRRNEDYRSEVAMWQSVVGARPHARSRQNLGRALLLDGRVEEAETQLREALRLDPRNADALVNLGNIALHRARYDEAIAHYEVAITVNSRLPFALNNLGAAYAIQGRWDLAIENYRRALKVNRGYADARRNLGVALMETDRLDEAIASLREAIRLRPSFADAHCSLGRALERSGSPDEARSAYRRTLELAPDHPRARAALERLDGSGIDGR